LNVPFRVGFGFDVHEFTDGRKLILGGIEIPHEKGLLGHSDADVLLHAVCDAILGALSIGDIGYHFPDSDPKFKNIDSKELLLKVYYLMRDEGYSVVNLDSTVLLQQPKIAPYIPSMRKIIAGILGIGVERVSVKATTTENLGFVGRKEGCAAQAVILITKEEK
jgi:2-C-methyl-D-erythritol 2,4-cyclodiphosphate synthase